MNIGTFALTAFILAAFVEGTVQYFLGSIPEKKRPLLKYIAAALGIVLAFSYKIDILAALGVSNPNAISQYIGYAISGIIIGRGSNYLNDFVSGFGKNKTTVTSSPSTPSETTVKVSTPASDMPPG